jgi:hypothetical protein
MNDSKIIKQNLDLANAVEDSEEEDDATLYRVKEDEK